MSPTSQWRPGLGFYPRTSRCTSHQCTGTFYVDLTGQHATFPGMKRVPSKTPAGNVLLFHHTTLEHFLWLEYPDASRWSLVFPEAP